MATQSLRPATETPSPIRPTQWELERWLSRLEAADAATLAFVTGWSQADTATLLADAVAEGAAVPLEHQHRDTSWMLAAASSSPYDDPPAAPADIRWREATSFLRLADVNRALTTYEAWLAAVRASSRLCRTLDAFPLLSSLEGLGRYMLRGLYVMLHRGGPFDGDLSPAQSRRADTLHQRAHALRSILLSDYGLRGMSLGPWTDPLPVSPADWPPLPDDASALTPWHEALTARLGHHGLMLAHSKSRSLVSIRCVFNAHLGFWDADTCTSVRFWKGDTLLIPPLPHPRTRLPNAEPTRPVRGDVRFGARDLAVHYQRPVALQYEGSRVTPIWIARPDGTFAIDADAATTLLHMSTRVYEAGHPVPFADIDVPIEGPRPGVGARLIPARLADPTTFPPALIR